MPSQVPASVWDLRQLETTNAKRLVIAAQVEDTGLGSLRLLAMETRHVNMPLHPSEVTLAIITMELKHASKLVRKPFGFNSVLHLGSQSFVFLCLPKMQLPSLGMGRAMTVDAKVSCCGFKIYCVNMGTCSKRCNSLWCIGVFGTISANSCNGNGACPGNVEGLKVLYVLAVGFDCL